MKLNLDNYTPLEIIQAVRAKDQRIIRALVIDGVKVKKIWSQVEVANMVNVDEATISRWINGNTHAKN